MQRRMSAYSAAMCGGALASGISLACIQIRNVIPGLDPAIQTVRTLDARLKAGHDRVVSPLRACVPSRTLPAQCPTPTRKTSTRSI
jgi:hypothetical protein